MKALSTFLRKDINNTNFVCPKKMRKIVLLTKKDEAKQKIYVISLN